MKTPKITKKDIYVLLIGIFLATLLTPLLNGFYQIILNGLASVSKTFESFYYESMGMNIADISYFNSIILMTGLIIFFTLAFTITFFLLKYLKDKYNSLEDEKDSTVDNNWISKHSTRFYIMTGITAILLLILYSYIIISNNVYMKNAEFNKDLTIISPYVDNQKILELKSDWVRMTSKEDYSEIQNDIEKIKKEYNLLNS